LTIGTSLGSSRPLAEMVKDLPSEPESATDEQRLFDDRRLFGGTLGRVL
jgi:hypothetical protein